MTQKKKKVNLSDTPEEVKRVVENNGTCIRCGSCCSNPPSLFPEDIDRISFFLETNPEAFKQVYTEESEYLGQKYLSLKTKNFEFTDSPDHWKGKKRKRKFKCCIFLQIIGEQNHEKGKMFVTECYIHKIKPFVCQLQICSEGKLSKKSVSDWLKNYIVSREDDFYFYV